MRSGLAAAFVMLLPACGGTAAGVPSTPDVPRPRDAFVLDLAWADDAAVPVDSGIVPLDLPIVDDVPTVAADVPPVEDVPVAVTDVPTAVDASTARCPVAPACALAAPTPSPTVSWRNLLTRVTVAKGAPRHRGRDLFLRAGEPQWAIAKFAYGILDDDLTDEDVEVFLLRDCATWERLGVARTSRDAAPNPTVEDVPDDGGRVYFRIPQDRPLGVGWHRVHFVVRGDHSVADQWIRVAPAGARFAVTDIDGTLTDNENAQFVSLLTGTPPGMNPGGPAVIRALAELGYEVLYLTARPEWLVGATHTWLRANAFPRGVVHTTLGLTGALGGAALTFKSAELAALRARFGVAAEVGLGNTDSDVSAYTTAGVRSRFYYRYAGDVMGGTRVDDYNALAASLRGLVPMCR
jgi:phosphoserine phosphatase